MYDTQPECFTDLINAMSAIVYFATIFFVVVLLAFFFAVFVFAVFFFDTVPVLPSVALYALQRGQVVGNGPRSTNCFFFFSVVAVSVVAVSVVAVFVVAVFVVVVVVVWFAGLHGWQT